MRLLALLSIILTTSALASGLEAKLRSALPAPLNSAVIGKTTWKELQATMGKPDLTEGSKKYWIKDGLKYAVALTFAQDKLVTIHYTFTKDKPSFETLYSDLKESKFEPYNTRYLIYRKPNVEVVIDPEAKVIYSLRLR